MKFLKLQKIITNIFYFAFIFIHYNSFSQELKSYKGSYKWGNNDGIAEYSYYDKDGNRFFDGKFNFTCSVSNNQGKIDLVITGQFKNGEVDGTWQGLMTGKLKNTDVNSRLTGNFVSGKPDGLFEQRVILLDTTIIKIKYKNGLPFGDFYYYKGSSQEKIIAKFAENGMLIGDLEYQVKNEAEITTFDNKNCASLVRQYSNGQEFKRVDVLEKVNAMSPKNISWVVVNYKKGSDIISNIWSEGNFGHLNGVGSLNTNNLNNMFYLQFQKLVSLEEAGFTSIEVLKKLDPSKPLTHKDNNGLYDHWTYIKENKQPEFNERKYIIKSDISGCDSVNYLFEGILLSKVDEAFKFQPEIDEEKNYIQQKLQKLKEIEGIYISVGKLKIGNLTLEKVEIDPEIQTFEKNFKSQEDHLNALITQINSPYRLLQWKEKIVQLDSIKNNFKVIKTDELDKIKNKLDSLSKFILVPWIQSDEKIRGITINQKEFEDLARIYNILIEDAAAKIKVLNTKILDVQFTDLLKIQTKIKSLVENPSENYKPIRKELKNAVTPTELRTILKL